MEDMRHARQNRIQSFAFVTSVLVAVCFSIGFISNHGRGQQNFGRCEVELEGRINPNLASVESLARLPGMGPVRAGAIITYRENLNGKDAATPAFRNCDDLQKVKGIGPKTAQNIIELLKFD